MVTKSISVAIIFFISGRRRHRSFDCDWSSDVCSSDLVGQPRVDHRRRLVDTATDLRDDLVDDPHHVRVIYEADARLLELAATLDEDAVRPVDHHFGRSEEHTSELQSQSNIVCRLLLEK